MIGFFSILLVIVLTAGRSAALFEPLEIGSEWGEQDFVTVSMVQFNGGIYLGTRNELDPEGLPENAGCQILHLFPVADGWDWKQVNDNGFGFAVPWNNFSVAQMTVFKDQLYVGVWNNTDGAQLWRTVSGVTAPESNDDWERVDQGGFFGFAVTSLQEFKGFLYAGIFTQKVPFLIPGCRIWRSLDGEVWTQVNVPGFGSGLGDWSNSDATTMAVFGNHLYVGTENGYYRAFGIGSGTQIWRTDGEIEPPLVDDWELVSRDGFGDGIPRPDVANTTAMIVFDGELYVGVANSAEGAEIWSFDGATWTARAQGGIDNPKNVVPSFHSFCLFEDSLILGTHNRHTGAEVWQYHGQAWYQINIDGFGLPSGVVEPLFVVDDRLYAITLPFPDLIATTIWMADLTQPDDPDMDGSPRGRRQLPQSRRSCTDRHGWRRPRGRM